MPKIGLLRETRSLITIVATAILTAICLLSTQAYSGPHDSNVRFIPNSQTYWDASKHWTTNYGPAFRDTDLAASNFLPCTGQYALCFESGPEPLPCELAPDGLSAKCKCTVHTGLNFVLITAILNDRVLRDTVAKCGADGAGCTAVDSAPVCQAIQTASLIPGADVISDWSPDVQNLLTQAKPPLTVCPKAPYAGCMTAPCKLTSATDAECNCPVFSGIFQLIQDAAPCTLDDDLIYSASYDPAGDGQ